MALKFQSVSTELTVVELTLHGITRKLRYFIGLTISLVLNFHLNSLVCWIYPVSFFFFFLKIALKCNIVFIFMKIYLINYIGNTEIFEIVNS